jgi:hypothetical protein
MEHIIERIIMLQGPVAILPENNIIQSSRLVSHLEEHAEFNQLGEYHLSRAKNAFEAMKAELQRQHDDFPLHYVALYTPAYVDQHQQEHDTSLEFVPFALWRETEAFVGHGNGGRTLGQ